jgi:hypothetical protein
MWRGGVRWNISVAAPFVRAQNALLVLSASRHQEFNFCSVNGHGQRFASHQFDSWPVLTEEVRCVVVIVRFHSNAAGLSAGAVRYLKMKIEADGFRILFDRLTVAAHLVSPRLRRAL